MYSRNARRILSILMAAALLIAGLGTTAFASVPAKVNSSSARVYQTASTRAASIPVPKNLEVSITAIAGGWAQVNYRGYTAYMSLSQLTPTEKVEGYATGTTNVYAWNLAKMGSIPVGTGVYVLGTIGDYYLVMSSAGGLGYIANGALSPTKPSSSGSSAQTASLSKTDKVLMVAQALLGRPYSSGSNPPNSFDCSSFVWYCMGMAGISVNKTSLTQAADGRYSLVTSASNLKAGDMLFFDTTGNGVVDHSAIYIGGDKFVEASRNAGKVQVNTLTSWYQSHFVCARRPS